MHAVTNVVFDRHERKIIAHAMLHLRIAYPDWDKNAEKGGDENKDGRSLSAIVSGTPATKQLLERATRALRKLYHQCEVESERAYWEKEIVLIPAADALKTTAPGGISLIAPGADMPGVLAETRAGQAMEALEAFTLVAQALELATAAPDEDE